MADEHGVSVPGLGPLRSKSLAEATSESPPPPNVFGSKMAYLHVVLLEICECFQSITVLLVFRFKKLKSYMQEYNFKEYADLARGMYQSASLAIELPKV